MKVLQPPALVRGDAVAVVSPSGPLSSAKDLERGIARLKSWGLRPTIMPNARRKIGYLAGDDKHRAADFQAAIEDPELRGILCLRGGYGAMRILDKLDFKPLRDDPKPILGYSDITVLLAATWKKIGLIGLHGPMVATSERMAMGTVCRRIQQSLLMDGTRVPLLRAARGDVQPHVIRPGAADGRLVGGNLTMVATLLGTPWQIDTQGALLFLEEVGEDPYRIDRTLTQLRLAGALHVAAGIILGDFHEPDTPLASQSPEITRVLHDCLEDLGPPVAYGFPFGHRPRSWSLPFGAKARLDARDAGAVPTLRLLEAAVR